MFDYHKNYFDSPLNLLKIKKNMPAVIHITHLELVSRPFYLQTYFLFFLTMIEIENSAHVSGRLMVQLFL